MKRTRVAVALAALAAVAGCSGEPDDAAEERPKPAAVEVSLRKVATLYQPLAFALHPSGPSPVYIAEKTGAVRVLDVRPDGKLDVRRDAALDISDRVSNGGEQGLLGIAFGPDGKHLYANYTNKDGDTRVVAYPFADEKADAAGERVLLAVDQPFPNHNGGHLVFGPDGMLYIGLGDGGGGGDPEGNAQDLTTLLGKILRIEPTPSGYSVPSDNPFMARGADKARPEIWHYGLRNPWRFSFDRNTGDMWIADVGQHAWEEINHVDGDTGGFNLGWNFREGAHKFRGEAPDGVVDPVAELSHKDGNCSVTGGYVYRGKALPGLAGKFVFADFCVGQLMAATDRSTSALGVKVEFLSAFGEDAEGELYALSLGGDVFRLEAK